MLVRNPITTPNHWLYNALWISEHVAGPVLPDTLLRRARDYVRARIERDLDGHPHATLQPVPRTANRSVDYIRENYLLKGLPVVVEGAASEWNCCRSWSPDRFAERYGDDLIRLITAGPEALDRTELVGDSITLRDLVARMHQGSTVEYARFSPVLHDHPELVHDFDRDWLKDVAGRRALSDCFQLFMGARGTKTATHCAIGSNLFTQIYGEKTWRIYPTDNNPIMAAPILRAPYFFSDFNPETLAASGSTLYPHATGYEARLRPGDVLYNPPFYWHYVVNETDSIGVGFRWFDPLEILRSSITQGLLTVLATNPPVWVAKQNRRNFLNIFSRTKFATVKERDRDVQTANDAVSRYL